MPKKFDFFKFIANNSCTKCCCRVRHPHSGANILPMTYAPKVWFFQIYYQLFLHQMLLPCWASPIRQQHFENNLCPKKFRFFNFIPNISAPNVVAVFGIPNPATTFWEWLMPKNLKFFNLIPTISAPNPATTFWPGNNQMFSIPNKFGTIYFTAHPYLKYPSSLHPLPFSGLKQCLKGVFNFYYIWHLTILYFNNCICITLYHIITGKWKLLYMGWVWHTVGHFKGSHYRY